MALIQTSYPFTRNKTTLWTPGLAYLLHPLIRYDNLSILIPLKEGNIP
jgi:hypothetical protein